MREDLCMGRGNDEDSADGGFEKIQIPREVVDAVLELANNFDWDGKRRVIELHPTELLGEYADYVLVELLRQYQDQPDMFDALTGDRALLADCRQHGVAEAFAWRVRPSRDRELTPQVVDRLAATTDEMEILRFLSMHPGVRRLLLEAVQSLVAAATPAAKRAVLVREKDLLLTAAAEVAMRTVGGEAGPVYQAHADLTAFAREHGIDAAIVWASGDSADDPPSEARVPEVDEILQEMAFAERYMTNERRLELARRGLELVEPETPLWAFFRGSIAGTLLKDFTVERPNRLEEAIEGYQATLRFAEKAGLAAAAATAHVGLSNAYGERVRGDRIANLERAVQEAELAITTAPADDPSALLHARYAAANAYVKRSDADGLGRAYNHVQQALTYITPGEDPQAYAGLQEFLGMIARAGGPDEFGDGGVRHLRSAAEALDPQEDPDNWIKVKMELAWTLLHGVNLAADAVEEAIADLNAALALVDAARRPEEWARVHDWLADAYLWRINGDAADNLEQAIEHAQQALIVFNRDGFPDQWATAQGRLADAMRRRIAGDRTDNARRALEYLGELADYYDALDLHREWALVQEKLGATHATHPHESGVDHLVIATDYLDRAWKAYEQYGSGYDVARVRADLFSVGRARMAWDERSEAFVTKVFDHGDHALAWFSDHQLRDEQVNIHIGFGYMHRHLAGDTSRDPHLATARDHLEWAIDNVTDATRYDLLGARLTLGAVQARQGDKELALNTYYAVIDEAESLISRAATDVSRDLILKHLGQAYNDAAFLELERGRAAEALVLADRGRSRLLLDALGPELSIAARPEAARLRIDRAHARVRRLQAELNSPPGPLRDSDAQLGRQLAVARAELADALSTSTDAAAQGAEPWRLIPPGGALVMPVITSYGSAIFILPSGTREVGEQNLIMLDPDFFRKLSDVQIRWMENELRIELATASLSEWTAAIDEIAGWLWESIGAPVRQQLQAFGIPDGARLWIAVSPISNLLPLHAARRSEGGQVRTLLDDYVVSYTPNIRLLDDVTKRMQQQQRARKIVTALLLADSLGDLPYAAEEIAAIEELFPEAGRLALTGPEVTREALFSSVPGRIYVHVACHAYVNWLHPNYSGIQLAESDIVFASQLAALDLSAARLVTLSACESGVSDVIGSTSEYTGLAASLLSAGAPSVVATLWNVNDHASSLLMRRFYEEMMGYPDHEPAAALRQAQLWLRAATVADLIAYQPGSPNAYAAARRWHLLGLGADDRPYASPYFWSAFILVGA